MNTNFKPMKKPSEDLFSLCTTVEQISRALTITAEDTTDRFKDHDIEKNMSVLYLLSDALDRVARGLEELDEYRVQNNGYIG